jgi:hypothetical protein
MWILLMEEEMLIKLLKLAEIARKLQNLGIPLEFKEEDILSPVLIRQDDNPSESRVISVFGAATAVILAVRITSNSNCFAPSWFDLALPWVDPSFTWLADPAENVSEGNPEYRIPATSLSYDRHIVLNHKFSPSNNLQRGKSIEGYLLGFGYGAIPTEFRRGMFVPATLTVADQFEQEYSKEVELRVTRVAMRHTSAPSKTRRGRLFEKRDPIGARSNEDILSHGGRR